MGQIVGQKLRTKKKLTPLALKKLKVPCRYSDGNNLYLKIEDTGSRRWILRLSVSSDFIYLVMSDKLNLSDINYLIFITMVEMVDLDLTI